MWLHVSSAFGACVINSFLCTLLNTAENPHIVQADAWPIVLYPFIFVMPFSGSLLQMAGNTVRHPLLPSSLARGDNVLAAMLRMLTFV